MPKRTGTRLADLIEAAIEVFIAKGYRRTQMADVARAAAVSQGTLYNYVESKEALFYLILERGFGSAPPPDSGQLPIRTQPMDAIVRRISERMASDFRLPTLERAIAARQVVDARAELEAVIREYYQVVAQVRRAFDLIERSAVDLPEFAELLYIKTRRGRIERLTRYLESRISRGLFRPLPDPPTAARLILETVVWFARHRHNSPDSAMITDAAALDTTVDFLVNGLLAHPSPAVARTAKKKRGRVRSER
jgi:AcrR family transcriptional regulator